MPLGRASSDVAVLVFAGSLALIVPSGLAALAWFTGRVAWTRIVLFAGFTASAAVVALAADDEAATLLALAAAIILLAALGRSLTLPAAPPRRIEGPRIRLFESPLRRRRWRRFEREFWRSVLDGRDDEGVSERRRDRRR